MANPYTVAASITKYAQGEPNFRSCQWRPKAWARFFRCECYRLAYIVNGENWITFIYPVGKHGGVAFRTYKFNDLPHNLVVTGEDSRSALHFMKQIIDTYVKSM